MLSFQRLWSWEYDGFNRMCVKNLDGRGKPLRRHMFFQFLSKGTEPTPQQQAQVILTIFGDTQLIPQLQAQTIFTILTR